MSGYVPKLKAGASVEEKLIFLQGQIEQLSKRLSDKEKEIDALNKLVDPNIKTRSLLNLLRDVNAHTSSMPDMKGYNADHDRRYAPRTESPLHEFVYLGVGGRRLWRLGVESGNMTIRFDRNLGVGAEDWTGDPLVRWYPNFD